MANIGRGFTRQALSGIMSALTAADSVVARQIRSRAPVVHGIGLIVEPSDEALFERTASAFVVIRDHAPEEWQKLRDSTDYVVVHLLAGEMRGRYRRVSRSCDLDIRFLRGSEPARIAQQLVHDALHASRPDISYRTDPGAALSVERACLEAEIVFATRLPEASQLASAASARLLTVEQDYSKDHEALPRVPGWLDRLMWRLLE